MHPGPCVANVSSSTATATLSMHLQSIPTTTVPVCGRQYQACCHRGPAQQALAGLLGAVPQHKGALSYAEDDVVRLRHLIWNGYGDEARRALRCIAYMAGNAIWLNGESGRARTERFTQFSRELETYLTLNAAALADYGRRYRAGLRIATSGAESIVNNMVNARTNTRRQMRWSPRGAHRVLQVRAAVIDGRLGAGRLNVAA